MKGSRGRRVLGAAALLAVTTLSVSPHADAPSLRLPDLDNRLINPFQVDPRSTAAVFVFASVDCPISNRYAPELKRLAKAFVPRGVRFWLVYPNPTETVDAIRVHVNAFAYAAQPLRDPRHELVKLAKTAVTPEAAVFDRGGRLVYRGRIDDRYVSVGVERPVATQHDLENALDAVLAGKPVQQASTTAIGCFIADFAR